MASGTGRFTQADRLRRSREFTAVSRRGRRAASQEYVVIVAPAAGRPANRARLGVTVSRKVGNAVVRNRVKRRIREWFRHEGRGVGEACDVVVIARRAASRLAPGETSVRLSALVQEAAAR